uniref:Spondin domain-containing protein n=1 Tax=Ditylum brightwellii TaxID=49249 RepID=A0A7S2A5X7_9STRA|mmetsp:Transcript_9112/g.13563  ORF Transcript_9112/g.13563 Transcript_9112/m.13563 type:complete len:317 (+) Transcript_9112:90-1040(+)
MKLLFSTIIISSFLNCALADSFNFEHIGQSPVGSDVPTSRNVGYSITYTNKWTAQNHPFRYPSSDPHYSSFLWASHSSDYVMWENGGTATRGIENVAEIGSIGALRGEVQAEQNMGNVLDDVVGSMIGTAFDGATSISNEDLCVDASHPYVSGLGMIAPSPDWFSGAYNVPLRDEKTMTWYRRVRVNVYAWDAGTEDGDNYQFNNPATTGGVISAFMAGDTEDAVFVSRNGDTLRVLPVAELLFELEESSEKCATNTEDPTDTFLITARRSGNLRRRDCEWARGRRRRCRMEIKNEDGEGSGRPVSEQCPVACAGL